MDLRNLTNNDLYEEWTDAMELVAQDPCDAFARKREGDCLNEMVRRMQEAANRPLVRQEAQA